MKARAIVKIVICSIVALLLIGILTAALFFGSAFKLPDILHIGASNSVSERYDESSFQKGDAEITQTVRSIEIHWESGSIHVSAYDGDSVKLRETGARADDTMRWRCEDGKLVVHAHKSLFTFKLGGYKKDLELLLPVGIYNKLAFNTASADITLEGEGLTFGELDADSASGDLKVADCTVESLSFDSASGACSLSNCDVDSFDMDTASGEADLDGSFRSIEIDSVSGALVLNTDIVPDEISFDSTSGSAAVTLPADAAFRAELDSVSGKLRVSGFTADYSDDDVCYVGGKGAAEYDFNTVSGDVKIHAK